MKAQIIVWVCILSGMMGTAQTVEKEGIEEALKTAVYEILKLSAQQDVDGLNTKYIHKEYGIYDVFRIGVGDLFKRRSNISFAFPPEGHVGTMYPNLIGVTKENIIKQLVVYDAKLDCGEIEWDREGFFITDKIVYPKVTQIIEHQEKYDNIVHSDVDKQRSKFIEENSRRVVLTELDIIFYLTKIDGRWYLTLFDRVTTDCSA